MFFFGQRFSTFIKWRTTNVKQDTNVFYDENILYFLQKYYISFFLSSICYFF